MKFENLDSGSFRKGKPDDSSFAFLADLFEDERDHGTEPFLDCIENPVLKLDERHIPSFETYGCPVCRELYFSKEEARDCSSSERAFAEKFRNVRVGTLLKYAKTKEERMDHWGCGASVGTVLFFRIRRFSFCYDGFRCGKILTIHLAEPNYINADSLAENDFWSIATEEEERAFVERETSTQRGEK